MLVAVLEHLRLAAELERDVAVAEQAGGHDRRRGVGGQLERRVEVERDAGPVVVVRASIDATWPTLTPEITTGARGFRPPSLVEVGDTA